MPFLSETAAAHPDIPALIQDGRTWSFGEMNREVERVAGSLAALEVGPGTVVALKGHPTSEVLVALHGIWRAQGVVATLNPRWTQGEEARAMEGLEPSVILVGEGVESPSWTPARGRTFSVGDAQGVKGLPPLVRDPDLPDDPKTSAELWSQWSSRPAAHILTSGTSGGSRRVTLTFGNLRASALGSRERLGLGPTDRWLASLSLAHVGGLALVSRAAYLGSALVLGGGFSVEGLAFLMESGAITHASLVPTMLHQLLEFRGNQPAPTTLRCLLVGGARADAALLDRALALGFPLAVTYGLTEASSQVATSPPGLTSLKPGTVGEPLPGVELRLGEEGEILVGGATVAPGEVGSDGWLRTGDLAREDEDGHLWVTGRLSHRIISGGVNVDPAEVEECMASHPAVREVAVVGIPHPEWGERVVAAIVVDPGVHLGREELEEWARSSLSPAKRPRLIRQVSSIPRNPNGKVELSAVRALFSQE